MNAKTQILKNLQEEFDLWEELLSGFNERQTLGLILHSNWSIKDTLAHLMAWQQVSIARFEAAINNTEPVFPSWLGGLDPDAEENLEQYNARIYETYHALPWQQVHQEWRDGYLRFMKLAASVPENDLMDKRKYFWMHGYNLHAVLQGSYEHHHQDHLEPLLAWLRQHGDAS